MPQEPMTSGASQRTGGPRRLLAAVVGGVLAALMVSATGAAVAADPIKVLVFPFELVDTSQEGEMGGVRADQQARLELLTAELARMLAASGRYEVLPLDPVRADYDRLGPMRGCNGCDVDLARAAGAEQGMVGIVQKVSNLILDVALYVRDVKTGRVVQVAKTSIRGNTDESWLRGLRFLVDKRILAETPAAAN
jgi:hypothetical protein